MGEPQPVAGEAAVAAERGHLCHVAAEAGAGAIGRAQFQRGRAAQHGCGLQMGVGGQHDHLARAGALQFVVGGEGFDQQVGSMLQHQGVKTAITRILRQCGGNLTQSCLHVAN
jgi:hypothetical protein